MLRTMKTPDKAKAFEMLVEAYADKDNKPFEESASEIIKWCSLWFVK